MAIDKAVDSAVLDAGLKAIADAIREKGSTSDSLAFPDAMAAAISAIEAGDGKVMEFLTYTPAADITPSYPEFIEFGQTSITTPYIMAVYGTLAETSNAFAGYLGVQVTPWNGAVYKGSFYANYASAYDVYGRYFSTSESYFNSNFANGCRIMDGKIGWRQYDKRAIPTFLASNTYYIFLYGE